jgi:uncharacterized protein
MLDCPINLEIYQYEIGYKIIALDVNTSKFFEIDQLTSQILDLADNYLTTEIIEILSVEYPQEEIINSLEELGEMWEKEILNAPNKITRGVQRFHRYVLKLHPTSKCNLKCKYCFGNKVYSEDKNQIDLKTAKEAIDYLVYDFGKDGGTYKVDLTGSGEPLLRFDFIKEIKNYCEELSEKIGKRILVSLCTNGTLLTKEKSSYLKENLILYGVSVDGGEITNDSLRPYGNGQGSFEDIINNCREIENRDLLGFAVTLTGKYTNIKDIFLKLFKLHLADTISIKPIRLTPDNEYSINEDNIDQIKEGYNEFALFLIEETVKGNTEYLLSILKGADYFGKFLKRTIRNSKVIYRCSAGLDSFSVNYNGDAYICPVDLNDDAFKMGNIYDGIDQTKQKRLRQMYADNIRECQGCWARYLCAG